MFLSVTAKPSVRIPRSQRHQQPGSEEERRQCGLPSPGLPARLPEPSPQGNWRVGTRRPIPGTLPLTHSTLTGGAGHQFPQSARLLAMGYTHPECSGLQRDSGNNPRHGGPVSLPFKKKTKQTKQSWMRPRALMEKTRHPWTGLWGPGKPGQELLSAQTVRRKPPSTQLPSACVRALRPGTYPFLWEHSPFPFKGRWMEALAKA